MKESVTDDDKTFERFSPVSVIGGIDDPARISNSLWLRWWPPLGRGEEL